MATPSQVNAEIITIMTQLRVLPLLLTEGDILQNEQDRNTLKNAPEPVRIR